MGGGNEDGYIRSESGKIIYNRLVKSGEIVPAKHEPIYFEDFIDPETGETLSRSITKAEYLKKHPEKPKIVTICGSSKFVGIMSVCSWLIEKQEHKAVFSLHLLPEWYCEVKSHLAEYEEVNKEFDELHKRKIDISDEIFVVNKSSYIGDSTANEIKYAQEKGKLIRWYTDDKIGEQVEKIIKQRQNGNYA